MTSDAENYKMYNETLSNLKFEDTVEANETKFYPNIKRDANSSSSKRRNPQNFYTSMGLMK